MKDIIEYIVKNLVNQPNQVEIDEKQDGETTLFEIRVAEGDKGRIIGKQGRTIKAIRSLLHATAAKANKQATLEIP